MINEIPFLKKVLSDHSTENPLNTMNFITNIVSGRYDRIAGRFLAIAYNHDLLEKHSDGLDDYKLLKLHFKTIIEDANSSLI